MRLLLRLLVVAVLAVVVLAGVALYDLVFRGGQLVYGALGRDALVASCRPALLARLAESGFQPADLDFDERPTVTASTLTGRTLSGRFTFQDGVGGARVDGVAACVVKDGTVTIEVRTGTTPVRST